jgi:poly(A) polymerase
VSPSTTTRSSVRSSRRSGSRRCGSTRTPSRTSRASSSCTCGSTATARGTDSAVRRYVTDAGPLLDRLHKLTRSDCTTRNRRKAARLAGAYDDLEARIAALREQEELDSVRPDLDGNAIMEILGIGPGRDVGRAWTFLKELRLDRGPLDPDEARTLLVEWWKTQQPTG